MTSKKYISILKSSGCYDPSTELNLSKSCYILTAERNICNGTIINLRSDLKICKKLAKAIKEYPAFDYRDKTYTSKLRQLGCFDSSQAKGIGKTCALLYGERNLCPYGQSVAYRGKNEGEDYLICSVSDFKQEKSVSPPNPATHSSSVKSNE